MSRKIEKTVRLPAPPEAVWKALTDAEGITRWFSPEAKVTPGAGGSMWMSWGGGMDIEHRIEIWEPNKQVRSVNPARPQVAVEYHLEGKGGETVLRLVQSGFGEGADFDAEYDDTSRGWEIFLRNLRHALGHPGQRCRQVIIPVQSAHGHDGSLSRVLGKKGLAREGTLVGLAEGARYRTVTAAGETLSGVLDIYLPPHAVGGTISEMNDALWRVDMVAGGTLAWCSVLLYGVPDAEVEALRARWTRMLTEALS